jgi:tRNA nucleotidyltransferase (CCA-adding enzyme)
MQSNNFACFKGDFVSPYLLIPTKIVLYQQNRSLLIELPEKQLQLLRAVGKAADALGQPAWVVGGYVRDYYLHRLHRKAFPEMDFATVGSGVSLAEKVAEQFPRAPLAVYRNFGTAQLKVDEYSLEFVGARKESYHRDSRKPIVEDGTLEDDQQRRDFTINAMYWSVNSATFGQLIDPFNGLADLERCVIRTPVNPDITFSDDPLRMLRAIRFAAQLGFSIDLNTWEGLQHNRERIRIISKERIADELNKMVLAPKPSMAFELLYSSGLLKEFFPEMAALQGVKDMQGQRHKDNFWHTLQVLDNVADHSDNLWLRWAAIMHDIAKPPTQRFEPGIGWTFHGHDALGAKMTKRIFRELSLPLDDRMKYVAKLVRLHLRPIALVKETVTDSGIRRLLFDAGDDLEDLMLLCRADITSKNDDKVKRYLKNFDHVERRIKEVEEKDNIRNWKSPVDGTEIMTRFNLQPGRMVGLLKDALKEAVLTGEIPNAYEPALVFLDARFKALSAKSDA